MDQPENDRLDALLHALDDPTRRRIYRLLSSYPGLTTNQLSSRIPGMTRWGVMKHLAVLRGAGLVQSFEAGRNRRHYGDAAQLELVRRWLDE